MKTKSLSDIRKFVLNAWCTVLLIASPLVAIFVVIGAITAWESESKLVIVVIGVLYVVALIGAKVARRAEKMDMYFAITQLPFVLTGSWLFYLLSRCGHC